jgi:fermentation-respiration switch protein FrsA (DUF1100 family)
MTKSKTKTKKVVIWAVVAMLIIVCVYTIGGGLYMIDYALIPKDRDNYKQVVLRNDTTYSFMKPWNDSLSHAKAIHDTVIVNKDGLKLNGYYIRSAQPTGKTAILIHGYTDCAASMMPIAHIYNCLLGYNVLLPELQFHGKSEGEAANMGWKDRIDVIQWAKVANSIFGNDTKMVIHGISMGGATTMMVSGEKLPPYIKCFVDDCGYTSAWDEFNYELKELFGLPTFPLLYGASAICKLRFGWSFGEASALKQVAKCKLPMLFIHGDADTYVPTRMVYPLYEAKPQPKELWLVKGAAHAASFKDNQEAYTRKITQFVNKYIR